MVVKPFFEVYKFVQLLVSLTTRHRHCSIKYFRTAKETLLLTLAMFQGDNLLIYLNKNCETAKYIKFE